METGIYQIEFFDGSVWNLYFANSTQKRKILQKINENKILVKSFALIVSGIHTASQTKQVFEEVKSRR